MTHEVSTLCRFSAGSDQTLVLRSSVSFSDCYVVDLTKRKTIGRDLMNSRHMWGNVRDFAKLAIKAFVGLLQADRIFVRLLSALSTFIFAFFCVSPAFACATFGITISADKNSAMINDYVTISVTISGAASYSSQTQYFHLVDGGTTLISDSPWKQFGNFTKNYTIQLTSAKTYSIQGVIDGDLLACASTSNIATVTVNKPSTTNTLYVTNAYTNGASSNYGDPVDIVAQISPAGATGTVTFKDGGTTLGTGTPNGGGYASFQTSSLSVGTHSITAVYGGDGSYAGSTSSAVSFPVNKNSTGTSITSSSYNPNPGQNITLTANISPSVNSGSVTFKDGSNTIASGRSVSGGSASFATSSLSAGSHNITAEYTGDSNYNASTSSSITVTVGTPPTASANTTAKNLTVGTTMSSFTPLTGSGGTAPLTYYVSSGSLPSGLSLNSSSGAVTGTPSAPYNTANVVFSVKDSINLVATTTSSVSFTVSAAPTAISGPTTQTPTVGTPMSFTPLSVSGGARPLTYFYSGTLPPGLTFDASTGQVAGTPSGPYSTASVVFSVKDANNVVAPTTNSVSFTVASAPTATAAAIPAQNLTVGTAISSFTPLAGSGGTAPLTYYVSSGSLPSGISLNSSSGEVGGTPSAPYSTANVVFSVRDANNSVPSTTSSVSFTVSVAPTASAGPTAQTPTVGTPMSFTPLSVSGGARPLTYYVSSGILPPGLTLDASTGQVAGTPSGPYSTASVVFEVKDANNVVAPTTNSVSFTVASAPTATAAAIPAQNLTVGTAISSFTPLAGSGGTAPLTYYVSSGSLPTGLSLNSSSGAVTGTPSAAYSTANVVFSVKDANNSVPSTTSSVSFTVSAIPTATANTTAQTLMFGVAMPAFTPLLVAGGARPLTYYVSSGTLPPGLSLNASTGAVTGTPTAIYSTANVVFSVKDANNVVATTTSSVNFRVLPATTTITITSSSATPTFGKSVQFTATIAPQTATGTVTFKDGTIVLGAVTVSGGNASFTTSSLSPGAHSITAIYSGDVNHVSSTSSPMIVTSTRPNPANDPNVRGIAISQVSTAQRTAQQTISTVQRRLETIHSDDTPGFSNGIGFSVIEPQSRFGQQQAEKEANPLAYSDMKKHGIVDPAKLLLRKEGEPASSNPINGAASVLSPDFNAWTAGSIIIGDQSYTGQVNQSRFSMSAVTAGIDTRVRSDMKAGFAVGLSTDRTKINNDTASNNGTSVTGTAYVSWQAAKGLFIDSLVGYGRLNFSSSRYDSNAGSSITGARTGSVLFGSVIASFEQRMGAFQYAPYGGFDILMGKLNAYTEAGDADWVLNYTSASVSSQGLILGFRGQYDMPMSWGTLSPTARVQFRHGMSGNVTQSMNYTADTSTSYALSISGTEQNSITSSIGLRAQSTAGISGQFEYLNNVMMNGRQSNGLRGMLMIPF